MNQRTGTAGTVQAFRLAGVPIRLHFTFVLFFLFLLLMGMASGPVTDSLVFLTGVFGSVLLHEFAHTAVCGLLGVRTEEIVMLPIGGISRLERRLAPIEEIGVASVGPLANLVLAGALFWYVTWTGGVVEIQISEILSISSGNIWQQLAYANLLLAGFNMIPAFPMDGGRVMRGLLSLIRPEDEATRTMAWLGRMIAISMAFYGFFYSVNLVLFLAFFIWASAAQENVAAMGRTLTYDLPVRSAMLTEFRILEHSTTMHEAASLLIASSQNEFPVTHGDQVVGILDRKCILQGLAQEGPHAYVAGVMDRDLVTIEADEELSEILPAMARPNRYALVMEGGDLVGMLTSQNVAEFIKLRRAGFDLDVNDDGEELLPDEA